jgi:DNA-binding LytR/AlgR family response regulator
MIRIAICDDEEIFVDEVYKMIRVYQDKHDSDIIVDKYTDSLLFVENLSKYEMVFLDVEMPLMDGFSVARRLNKLNNSCYICFLTSKKELGYKGFEVSAKNYLIKPVGQIKINNELEKVFSYLDNKKKSYIGFNKDMNKPVQMKVSDIISIEANGRSCSVKTKSGYIEVKEKFKDILERIDYNVFFSPHRSYLINLWKVTNYSNTEINMIDESIVPMSRLRLTKFRDKYYEFIVQKEGE